MKKDFRKEISSTFLSFELSDGIRPYIQKNDLHTIILGINLAIQKAVEDGVNPDDIFNDKEYFLGSILSIYNEYKSEQEPWNKIRLKGTVAISFAIIFYDMIKVKYKEVYGLKRANNSKVYSERAIKAWETRRKNEEEAKAALKKEVLSARAHKAWETRKANAEKTAIANLTRGQKAWATRRAKAAQN